jgi:hypothetical protein
MRTAGVAQGEEIRAEPRGKRRSSLPGSLALTTPPSHRERQVSRLPFGRSSAGLPVSQISRSLLTPLGQYGKEQGRCPLLTSGVPLVDQSVWLVNLCLERVPTKAVAAKRVPTKAVATKAVATKRVPTKTVAAGHSERPVTALCVAVSERPECRDLPASAAPGPIRTMVVAATAAAAEMPATTRRVMVLRMRCSLQNVPLRMFLAPRGSLTIHSGRYARSSAESLGWPVQEWDMS